MNYYITNFGCLKKLKENQIPLSTAVYPPKFWKLGPDRHNVFLGINIRELSPYKLDSHNVCTKCCPYKESVPNCPFLIKYEEYLNTVDFNKLITDFKETAEEVRKATNYKGEPDIVLLVYEALDNPCSERHVLKRLFKKHNIDLIDIV